MKYDAVKSSRFIQIRQPLSGYALGWERKDCWRLRCKVGLKSFLSEGTYSTKQAANSAALRLNRKTQLTQQELNK